MKWTWAGAAQVTPLQAAVALADEGGASVWLPGQFASFAAVPADSGFSLETILYARKASLYARKASQSGMDSHVDLGTFDALSEQLYVGAVGYLYKQLRPDTGGPARPEGWNVWLTFLLSAAKREVDK